jgi:hypothetical protein
MSHTLSLLFLFFLSVTHALPLYPLSLSLSIWA